MDTWDLLLWWPAFPSWTTGCCLASCSSRLSLPLPVIPNPSLYYYYYKALRSPIAVSTRCSVFLLNRVGNIGLCCRVSFALCDSLGWHYQDQDATQYCHSSLSFTDSVWDLTGQQAIPRQSVSTLRASRSLLSVERVRHVCGYARQAVGASHRGLGGREDQVASIRILFQAVAPVAPAVHGHPAHILAPVSLVSSLCLCESVVHHIRVPCLTHHHCGVGFRLDWHLWIIPLGVQKGNPLPPEWYKAFLAGLLKNTPSILSLIQDNPFPDKPPRYVRTRVTRTQHLKFFSNTFYLRMLMKNVVFVLNYA